MNSAIRAIYRIEVNLDGPARARRIVSRELARMVPAEKLEELKLMISEVVTKAVVHGAVQHDDTITLDLRVNGIVRCEVTQGRNFAGGPEERDSSSIGMRLIDRLARRWGITHADDGTRVWFETAQA